MTGNCRLVFRGGAFPFHVGSRLLVRALCGDLLLVPEGNRKDDERDAWKLHFWLSVIGFNMTFIPMHFLGFLGMPRRIYTYAPGRGWEDLNLVASIGVIFQIIAVAILLAT